MYKYLSIKPKEPFATKSKRIIYYYANAIEGRQK